MPLPTSGWVAGSRSPTPERNRRLSSSRRRWMARGTGRPNVVSMRNNTTIKVLVVDGAHADREHLGPLLRARGLEVICASDGAEAIEIARRSLPSIVVADFLMAAPNGDTLLHLWKA